MPTSGKSGRDEYDVLSQAESSGLDGLDESIQTCDIGFPWVNELQYPVRNPASHFPTVLVRARKSGASCYE